MGKCYVTHVYKVSYDTHVTSFWLSRHISLCMNKKKCHLNFSTLSLVSNIYLASIDVQDFF